MWVGWCLNWNSTTWSLELFGDRKDCSRDNVHPSVKLCPGDVPPDLFFFHFSQRDGIRRMGWGRKLTTWRRIRRESRHLKTTGPVQPTAGGQTTRTLTQEQIALHNTIKSVPWPISNYPPETDKIKTRHCPIHPPCLVPPPFPKHHASKSNIKQSKNTLNIHSFPSLSPKLPIYLVFCNSPWIKEAGHG